MCFRLFLFLAMLSCPFFAIQNSALALSLKEAVRKAVNEHPSGLADRANVSAVASELDESRRSFKPTIELFGDAGAQNRESPTATSVSGGGTGTLFAREIGVRGELLLFDGFERANNVYRNAARLDAATFRLLSTTETLALNAVEAYVDVVRHRNLVAAARRNVTRHREILRQIRARVEGGKSPASDRIQIEERVFAAEAVTAEVEGALAEANDRFKKAVGRGPGKKMKVPVAGHLPKSKKSLVASALANSFVVRQAEKVVSEFEFNREVVRAGNKPRIALEGRASHGEDRNGTVGDESDLFLGLTLSWRLYDGGQIMARERTTTERVTEAQFRVDVARRDVTELAANAWNALSTFNKRNAILKKQLQTNDRIVASYLEEYELSKRSLLDVLDAERARFNNRFQQISVAAGARFTGYRVLATMSKLGKHFGLSADVVAPVRDYQDRFTATGGSPSQIFDISIEPLR